jgi:zinc protease
MQNIIRILVFSLSVAVSATVESPDIFKDLVIPNETYKLDNGLNVILSPDKRSPFVAVSLWYNVGAINETFGKTGLAHLFEHLMFEGSRNVKAGEHFKILDSLGAFAINATTSFDRTNYYETVPKAQLPLALALEERMSLLALDQAKLNEQRAVVRREREQRYETVPYGIATMKAWQELFPEKHPFHGRVIGSHEDLERATLADVQAFYDKHYGPSNASLCLVGDYNPADVKNLINKYFGAFPKSQQVPNPVLPKIDLGKERIIEYSEKIGSVPLLRIHYLTPALFTQADADLDIAAHLLTGNENARLTKALTRDEALASNVSTFQQSLEQGSVFTIDALLYPGVDEKKVISIIDRELSSLVTKEASVKEIDRARNAIATNFFFGLQELGGSFGRAELLQSYYRYTKDTNFIRKDVDRYLKVTGASIAETAKIYLPTGEKRVILIARPEENKIVNKEASHE